MSFKRILPLLFPLAQLASAQDVGDRDIALREIQIAAMPGLQSFAWGQVEGQWFLIGGRLDGLHRRQPFAAFLASDNNTMAYVVDPLTQQVWSASLSTLPQAMFEQLQSTNMEFMQRNGTLYVIGGYGYSPTAVDHITYPNLTAIDLPGVMDAIRNGQPIAPFFRQITDTRMEVTGGQLGRINDHFLLVGGQRFIGRYNPMGPDFGPGFVQEYTNAIRKFRIDDDGTTLTIADHSEEVDTMELHRRDYNMVPQIFPDGSNGYTVFSGVFQYSADVPWLNTVDITASEWTVVPVFEQLLNQYHTAHAALWDGTTNTMRTLFFGGIGRYYFEDSILMDDPNVPFVNTISRVTRQGNGELAEAAVGQMPGLLGSGAEFIPYPGLPLAADGIIRSDLLVGDSVLIGHIVGGVESTAANIFFINTGVQSDAVARVFEVWLVRQPAGVPVIGSEQEFGLDLRYTTGQERLIAIIRTAKTTAMRMEMIDSMGRKVRQVFEGRLVQGRHELNIPVSDLASGAYTIVLSNGSQQRTMKFIR
jgi:hypothetical protein